MQLDCPTEAEPDQQPVTVETLKEEITSNCGEDTVLIFPQARRLTPSKCMKPLIILFVALSFFN
jgi:hypothetical protein